MASENLLYLTHRIPYPPNKGDKIRSFHLLQHLNARYKVHLGSFIDDENDWQHEADLRKMCGECCLLPLHPRRSKLRSLSGLLSGKALTLPYYRNKMFQAWVNALVKELDIERIVVFSSAMAQYVEHFSTARRVMDFVDVDSDKWSQYAESKRWPLSWLYRREGMLLLDYERSIARQFTASFFVSTHEATLFKSLAPESANKIHSFDNGVDSEYFSPDRHYPDPFAAGCKAIVFTGAMDYWPNVDAVDWFAREIFPEVLKQVPQACFFIVGSNPAKTVQQLATLPGVEVTGKVADIRPYLAHAQLAVVPLRIARGVQNKVLEAMAMAKPVLATPQAVAGVAAQIRANCSVGATADELAAHVLSLLKSGKSTSLPGREAILEHYNWSRNLAEIDSYLESRP